MAKTKTTRYDVAEQLRNPKEMAAYLEACLEEAEGDAAFIAKALGDIARAKGIAQLAEDASVSRESLYKALSGERSPDFDTILKVIRALGLKLHAESVSPRVRTKKSDTGIPAAEVFDYLRKRVQGKPAARPKLRKIA
jgi:probable addiction module antidote protein